MDEAERVKAEALEETLRLLRLQLKQLLGQVCCVCLSVCLSVCLLCLPLSLSVSVCAWQTQRHKERQRVYARM